MFSFTPSTIPHNIFVVGAGGTGSRLIPLLAQFLRSITSGVSPTGWLISPVIWLIDSDVIESKNLIRQNFIERDVGKHKASVIADRYSAAYGVNIVPILKMVNPEESGGMRQDILNANRVIRNLTSNANNLESLYRSSIVIMCVDSVKARRNILQEFIPHAYCGDNPGIFFIDAGNEDDFGQVRFFNSKLILKPNTINKAKAIDYKKKLPEIIPSCVELNFIPMDFEYYRTIMDNEAVASCADLDQTLAINAIMATTILGVIQNYYYRKTVRYNQINISLVGGNSNITNTFKCYSNMAVTESIVTSYEPIKVKEKDTSTIELFFLSQCSYMYEKDLYSQLEQKIKEDFKAINAVNEVSVEESSLITDTVPVVEVVMPRLIPIQVVRGTPLEDVVISIQPEDSPQIIDGEDSEDSEDGEDGEEGWVDAEEAPED